MAEHHDFHLTVDAKYRVKSLLTRESVMETFGVFKGFAPVGSGDGLVFELAEGTEKGKYRIIPSHVIVAIDIVETPKKREQKERDDEADRHYL